MNLMTLKLMLFILYLYYIYIYIYIILYKRHGICVGFHIIKRAEGRNDVFSAVYTRWKKAPVMIVYDFSCQLQQFSLVSNPI